MTSHAHDTFEKEREREKIFRLDAFHRNRRMSRRDERKKEEERRQQQKCERNLLENDCNQVSI